MIVIDQARIFSTMHVRYNHIYVWRMHSAYMHIRYAFVHV
jgi:hypothetical protein